MLRLEYSPGDGFRVADGPAPSIASDEVLIRVEACGVCGSDRQVVAGESVPPGTAFPLVMGHEIAGQIIEVGADVIGWRQDDLVVVHPFVACGTCAPCLHDQANLCVRQTCIGYHRQGGFAQQVAIPAAQLVRRPTSVSAAAAALLVDAFATPFRAMLEAGVGRGQTVLVIGTGGLGLAALMLAQGFGVERLGAVTRRAEGVETAQAYGAETVVTTEADARTIARQLRRWSGASGIDVVVDTVATEETIALAMETVRPGGCVALVGMSEETAHYPIAKTVRRGVRLVASYGSLREDVEQLVGWVEEGRLNPLSLVAGTLSLDQAERAFSPVRRSGRWVVDPTL
ncbi:alcohol dehydrogenase catalytic domain-containing protein [Alicyclobacillus fastidiosus]|uniref:Alcohol dehydrogenase catalytic domain-containing protein n=1 Tax=Alicyclobacillus fastidiosus TaxID=392011 RepID=A0ABY6ZJL6_9BACL|nr:alcohol dehydrogenase catalytic domain-containing protein [Alicyclobacillus fastidiosus]WAH42783.1 alcohol dehydrogenase catalytic domain-containing protein [Alicyclobacillus fastidiosus]